MYQVFFSDFDYFGLPLLHLSGADSISFAPILTNETRKDWELFAASNQLWIDPFNAIPPSDNIRPIEDGIWGLNDEFDAVDDRSPSGEILTPIWQTTPISLRRNMMMHNAYSEPVRRQAIDFALKTKQPIISGVLRQSTEEQFQHNCTTTPRSIVVTPVLAFLGGQEVSGVILIEFKWDSIFENVLQDGEKTVHAVVESACGDVFTLAITGSHVNYIGEGDHHDPRYDSLRVTTNYGEGVNWSVANQRDYPLPPGVASNEEVLPNAMCKYKVHFYPTAQSESDFATYRPARFAVIVAMIFVFAICVFMVYDCLVERRQSVVMDTAVKSSNIVNELYPPEFVDRVIQPRDQAERLQGGNIGNVTEKARGVGMKTTRTLPPRSMMTPSILNRSQDLQNFLADSKSDITPTLSRPIAEMFPDVTVIFADISGFTAWSSEREPIQVFQLLEALYAAFDEAGKRLGVFKVETIGDCYVAVVGLPTPHQAHAVVMCRFAHEIHQCMCDLTQRLEVQLGPGTSDLQLRIGLHSGSVIAGVLRGAKSRFQLFGDTMNTAARMESTGERGKTQVSKSTAESLTAGGKSHWLIPRTELVNAKGKGELQTYWVNPSRSRDSARQNRLAKHREKAKQEEIKDVKRPSDISKTPSEALGRLSLDEAYFNETEVSKEARKKARMIEWNTEVLLTLLGRLEARRRRVSAIDTVQTLESSPADHDSTFRQNTKRKDGGQDIASSYSRSALECCARNECGAYDVVALPAFNAKVDRYLLETCNLSVRVREQLRDYVAEIAGLYNDLPFRK